MGDGAPTALIDRQNGRCHEPIAKGNRPCGRLVLPGPGTSFEVHGVDAKDEVLVARSDRRGATAHWMSFSARWRRSAEDSARSKPTPKTRRLYTFQFVDKGVGSIWSRSAVYRGRLRVGREPHSCCQKLDRVMSCSTAEHRDILDVLETDSPSSTHGLLAPAGAVPSVGTIPVEQRPKGGRMDRLPDSLAIALWVVGSCCVLAVLAYAIGASRELILPLVVLGILTGIAEWVMRRREK